MLSMTKTSRLTLIVIFIIIALLSIISLKPQAYRHISTVFFHHESSQNKLSTTCNSSIGAHPIHSGSDPLSPLPHRENAVIYMLTTNSDEDIQDGVQAVRELEDRFNHKYKYPWVFLNHEPFTDKFKSRLSILVSGRVEFGQIPYADWNQPPWVDAEKANQLMQEMGEKGIPRSGQISYHNMCRFNAGFFYRHPLLKEFKYAWRVEPHVHFYCDINFDPFAYLRENNKTYGFIMTMHDSMATMESLWPLVKEFIHQNPEYVAQNSAMDFLSDDGGAEYNTCIFYDNFEIADMDLWRGEAYSALFHELDRHGGFYYERWGDAPVHTIAAALLTDKDRIHFFREIGYSHYEYTHCPTGDDWTRGRCACDPEQSFDYTEGSCLRKWEQALL